MRARRGFLMLLLVACTALVPVGAARADLGTGNAWVVAWADVMWSGYDEPSFSQYPNPDATQFGMRLWPYGHTNDTTLQQYELFGNVEVPPSWCPNGETMASVEDQGTAGFSYDALNESYGGPVTGTADFWCIDDDGEGSTYHSTAAFHLSFGIVRDGSSQLNDCPPDMYSNTQQCTHAQGHASQVMVFCWYSANCADTTRTVVYTNELEWAHIWRGVSV